jgi:hypothetical protein
MLGPRACPPAASPEQGSFRADMFGPMLYLGRIGPARIGPARGSCRSKCVAALMNTLRNGQGLKLRILARIPKYAHSTDITRHWKFGLASQPNGWSSLVW